MEVCQSYISSNIGATCQKPKDHALPHRCIMNLFNSDAKQTLVVVEWGDASLAQIDYPVTPRVVESLT